jgi:hypothetical protein
MTSDILGVSMPPGIQQSSTSLAAGPVHVQDSVTKTTAIARVRVVAGQPVGVGLVLDQQHTSPSPSQPSMNPHEDNVPPMHTVIMESARAPSPMSMSEVAPPMYSERPPSPAHTAIKV